MKFFALFDDVFALRKQKGLAWLFSIVKVLGDFLRKQTLVLLHSVIQISLGVGVGSGKAAHESLQFIK